MLLCTTAIPFYILTNSREGLNEYLLKEGTTEHCGCCLLLSPFVHLHTNVTVLALVLISGLFTVLAY